MKIRRVSADVMDRPARPAAPARPSKRDVQRAEVERQILKRLSDPSVVLSISPEGEKPATLRARILRVAKDNNVNVAIQVRQDGKGPRLLVGLMTAERKSTRGRKPKEA